jgi:formylglycine-generating enzyme required for sulfatase activity
MCAALPRPHPSEEPDMRLRPCILQLLPACSVLALAACAGGAAEETENQPPGAPTVGIGPYDPRTGDDLLLVLDAPSVDPDGDTVSYRYAWKQDGLPRADLTAATVPASETTKGERWDVTVVPNDGTTDGAAASATVTVVNTLPTVTVAFAPEAPLSGDTLVAVATGVDADGDPLSFTYVWTVDGEPADVAEDSISGDVVRHGQRWTVTVTPADPEGAGLPVTAEVTIANSVPEVLGVTLAPAAPFVTDDVVASVDGYDADADGITYTYTFFVDGTEVQSGDSDTMGAGGATKHERIFVEVVPNDGIDDGAAYVSADVEVANALPVAASATIDPVPAYASSTLTCAPLGFADADGDGESWSYTWAVNGVDAGTAATLETGSFQKNDAVTCTATPFDGEASGAAVTSGVRIISNTTPVLDTVALSSTAPSESDTLTVTLGAATDGDGDAVTYSYAWYVNGGVVSSSASLAPASFDKGDSIYVVVRPYDLADYGAPVTSATATGVNTAPVVSSVTLSPAAVYTNDTLTASVSATDLDGDPLTATYAWYVGGVLEQYGPSASVSGATYFARGQAVYVVVTPNDGESDGAAASSSTVTVSNSVPTAPIVAVTPAGAVEGEDLTCSVTTASTDADGDPLAYDFVWDVDGVDYVRAADSATTSVVDGADVEGDTTWTCEVAASDGTATGPAGTDGVTAIAGYNTTYGSTMVAIAAGSFSMGSILGDGDEAPVHTVTLTHDFWIGQTEVTQAQYQAGMGTNPSYYASCGTDCPVERVSWNMAAVYANALSAAEGLDLCYTSTGSDLVSSLGYNPYNCEGYRLPTEAEWEYAAKAGGSYTYSGSSTIDDVAWYSGNSGSTTHAVAGKAANAWGLYDMSGNVWEWTNDNYLPYSATAAVDPIAVGAGVYRVVRGGDWYWSYAYARVSNRLSSVPMRAYLTDYGFRLARTMP